MINNAPKEGPGGIKYDREFALPIGDQQAYELYGVFAYDQNDEEITVTNASFAYSIRFPVPDENQNLSNPKDNNIIAHQILSTFKFISTSTVYWNTENVADFSGYYVKRENVYGEENTGPFTCDSFVVLNGDEALTKYFKDMVEKGNTVNALDGNKNLRINLDLNLASSTDKVKIINSTKEKPVTLTLKKKVEPGKGAPACYSFFNILEVK
jgi:hypothetical protein